MSRSLTDVLADPAALERLDPGGMLRAVASSAAQVREAATLAADAGLDRVAQEGRPRSVVVCGMGGSGIAGDVLAAVAGSGCPVPLVTHRGYGLPAWVGATDLVIAVSCSGTTEETLSALQEAVRRGCRLLVVAADSSPVADLGRRGRGTVVAARQGCQPRASVWSLSTPLVLAGDALGLLQAPPPVVAATADLLEQTALRCAADSEPFSNPAKRLAQELEGTLPVLWGTSPLAGVAAYRGACQLNENSKHPAVWGVLPEASHNQVVAFDGPFAGRRTDDDLFRDRADDDDGVDGAGRRTPLHLVLLRDTEEHPQVARRAEVCRELAQERGVGVSVLVAEGGSSLERLASLVGVLDWATTYLALLGGTDPTPVDAIESLKQRIR